MSYCGLVLLGIVCSGYFLFERNFAEIHLSLPFLDFPIFLGEIFLFLSLIPFLGLAIINRKSVSGWQIFFLLYFVFVLIKALGGRGTWGVLALRHAALFYCPLFAVFGYAFYRHEFFSHKRKMLFSLLLILALFSAAVLSSLQF